MRREYKQTIPEFNIPMHSTSLTPISIERNNTAPCEFYLIPEKVYDADLNDPKNIWIWHPDFGGEQLSFGEIPRSCYEIISEE